MINNVYDNYNRIRLYFKKNPKGIDFFTLYGISILASNLDMTANYIFS